jgi:magnesium-protoporphyrin IX monomethyl ester (oxidative) cyclase
LGLDPTEYDMQVFRITTEIAKQTFPVSLDLDNPAFQAGLDRMVVIANKIAALNRHGGVFAKIQRMGWQVLAGASFARLYFLRPKTHSLPANIRLVPTW